MGQPITRASSAATSPEAGRASQNDAPAAVVITAVTYPPIRANAA